MDKRGREIILKYKPILSQTVSLEKIKRCVMEYQIFTKPIFDDVFDPDSGIDFYDTLCTRGPNAFSNFIKILAEAGYHEFSETLQKEIDDGQYPTCYKMDSEPLGYCLIIINETFAGSLDNREGCEVDALALEKLFKGLLKFDVQIEWNKSGHEMENTLKEFSKKSEFRNVDCCIVYILSHGDQYKNLDFIYGTDCEKVYKKDIYTIFNNENCELLIGKPKIFFFQACRGKLHDKGKTVNSCTSDGHDNACKKQNSQDSVDALNPKFDDDIPVEQSYPILCDMFIVHSTLPDYKSFKNKFTGSWLCQDLVSVIPEYFDKLHLSEMMTIVCDKQKNRTSEDGYKQVTHCEQPDIRVPTFPGWYLEVETQQFVANMVTPQQPFD